MQDLAKLAAAGNDPKAGDFPNPSHATDTPLGSIDASETFSGGCPTSPVISAFGASYTMNLQPLCDLGGIMGQLNVLFAMIGALWMISGAVKG